MPDNTDTKAQTHCHCPEWHSRHEQFGALGAAVAERNIPYYYYAEEKCFKAAILIYVLQKMAAQKLRICVWHLSCCVVQQPKLGPDRLVGDVTRPHAISN